jgi:site-specific recombinase XerC
VCVDVAGRPPILISQCSDSKSATDYTYGTELAAAGIDLLVLRDLMGHASPETTAGYVHLSIETLSAEYTRAQAKARIR